MIQLDSLILPDLIWIDKYQNTGIDSRIDKTLTGRLIVWEQSSQGKLITLSGSSDTGWIEKEDLETLLVMAKVPNAIYELSYENVLYSVRFRHEEAPTIEAQPVVGRPNQGNYDYFNNLTIKLMEV